MRKYFISLRLITFIMCSPLCHSVPLQKSSVMRAQLNPYFLKAMAAYKKLEPKLPPEELRAITAIGILNGAKKTEQQMEKNLIKIVKDLLLHANTSDRYVVIPKITKIENQLRRDEKALEILTKSLDMATKSKDSQTFKKEMLDILKTFKDSTQEKNTHRKRQSDVGEKVADLRKLILKQIDLMKNVVDHKIDYTLEYLITHAEANGPLGKASNKLLKKRQTEEGEPARITQIKSLLTEDDFRNNLVEVPKADNDEDDSLEDDRQLLAANNVIETNSTKGTTATVTVVENVTITNETNLGKQEEGSPEFFDNDEAPPAAGGGGLVGIISSLSGGEGGSDIGALIGALTGVISQIFGPGGLDIESLISSATALISGLLSGNKNFGTVLGIYVGTAFDGLSGGGGAVNNGQFIGNFLGTVVASLSADPEEDDEPPKPLIFLQNLVSSFLEAKNRPLTEEESSKRKDNSQSEIKGGSDSSAFIKHIVSHVVGSLVSLILNTAVGASGGASQASHSIFASSLAAHQPPPEAIRG